MASESSELQSGSTRIDSVWRLFTDLRLMLALLMAAAALMVVWILLPDTAASAVGLRVALALLAFSLALRLVVHIETAARAWTGAYAPPELGLPAEAVALDTSAGNMEAQARAALGARYDRVIVSEAAPPRMLGIRRPAAAVGPILATMGALVILLGLLINATAGSATRDIVLMQGAETVRAGVSGWQVGFREAPSAIVLEDPAGEAALYSVTPLRPVLRGLHGIFPREEGPTLHVSATTAAGTSVALVGLETGANPETPLVLPFRGNQAEQTFTAPTQGLAFRAVSYPDLPERGVTGPVFLLEAYREGEAAPVWNELVEEQAALMVDDTTYLLRRGRYVTVDVAYAPGWPWMALGALTALIGLALVLFWPLQEAWIDVIGDERRALARVQIAGGVTPERAVAELVTALQESAAAGKHAA